MTTIHELSANTRALLGARQGLIIDGRTIADRDPLLCVDPATGATIGEAALATIDDVDVAARGAHASFADRRWRGKTPAERQRILNRVADLIDRDAQLFAELETVDGGKLYGAALHGEVPHAAETFRYYAGWVTKLGGQTFEPSVPGRQYHAFVRHDPVGVTGLITPWNGAIVAAAWKLAPALAAGCSCILKPSELTPLTSLLLGRLVIEAGVPEGVVQVLPGHGHDIGAAIVRHPLVAKISFTGSTRTGATLMREAAGDMTRLSLELGGKSPVVIFADADLDRAIPAAADAIFANAGQVCVAGSRIFAERSVHDRVIEGIAEIAGRLRLGPGLDAESQMGPLISDAHRQRVSGMVDRARGDGARIVCGGEATDGPGFFYRPTVIANADPSAELMQEEVFGPVVSVTPFGDEAEALRLANATRYGLAASIWTGDAARALRLVDNLEAGIVWINEHGIPELAMPIGGVKQSGIGREHGLEGLRAYTETRSVMMRID